MQQRRPRLGDIVDDYCPRERRITNHAVVAMIEDEVKRTRCTTCDAEHEFKQAKLPAQRRRKDAAAGAGELVTAPRKRRTAAQANTAAMADVPQASTDKVDAEVASTEKFNTEKASTEKASTALADADSGDTALGDATPADTTSADRRERIHARGRAHTAEKAPVIEETSDIPAASSDPVHVPTEPAHHEPAPVELAESPAAPQEAPLDEPADEDRAWEDEGPVHRRLIRATLPRPEGQAPERKLPEFTMHQREVNGNRSGRPHRRGPRQGQLRGQHGGGGQAARFGQRQGPPGGSRHGGPGHVPRHGSGQGGGGQQGQGNRSGGTGHGQPGQQRNRHRKRGR